MFGEEAHQSHQGGWINFAGDDCRGYQAYQLQGRGDCWLPQVSGMIYCQGDKNIITVLDPQAFHPKDHVPLNDLKRVEK